MTEAYPLSWPPHVPRCRERISARFHGTTTQTSDWTDGAGVKHTNSYRRNVDLTVAAARDDALLQIRRFGVPDDDVIISTNLRTRLDGLPKSNQAEPSDPGVAVYFRLDGNETCIAIDRFDRVADNLRAVAKTIEAMRGIERWGGATLVAAAFRGFQALPGPGASSIGKMSWWIVLGVRSDASIADIEARFRSLALECGPDRPGYDAEKFKEIVEARDAARRERAA